jgi:hypothetical protein
MVILGRQILGVNGILHDVKTDFGIMLNTKLADFGA